MTLADYILAAFGAICLYFIALRPLKTWFNRCADRIVLRLMGRR